MTFIEKSLPKTPTSALHSVEFYPSIDDHVYIGLRIGQDGVHTTWTTYAYYAFLFIETIMFPVFLFAVDLPLPAVVVFLFNLLATLFLVPKVNTDSYRTFYEKIYGDREKHVARVDLSDEGVLYTADDGYSFFPWRRIVLIEETAEAIYFFFDGNGFGIRKNGFPDQEQQKSFTDFARNRIKAARSLQLGP